MEKILHLTLKKKWFDMIASGEKKEEYREIKEYWNVRLSEFDIVSRNSFSVSRKFIGFKYFDNVVFTNGYGKNAPKIKLKFEGISIGFGNPDWGGGNETFIIKLGDILPLNR